MPCLTESECEKKKRGGGKGRWREGGGAQRGLDDRIFPNEANDRRLDPLAYR